MGKFDTELEECFGVTCIYKLFGVEKSAEVTVIKKAYYKMSLKHHPDRVGDARPETTKRFQILAQAFSIVSDSGKRGLYDSTGMTDDDEFFDGNTDWSAVWRSMFKPITEEDIRSFEKEYKDSEEERMDIKKGYIKEKGNMAKVYNHVMLSNMLDDEERIRGIIQEMIAAEEVEAYKAFTHETEKKKGVRMEKARKEADEAAELKDEMKARMAARREEGTSFLDSLAEKYGGKKMALKPRLQGPVGGVRKTRASAAKK